MWQEKSVSRLLLGQSHTYLYMNGKLFPLLSILKKTKHTIPLVTWCQMKIKYDQKLLILIMDTGSPKSKCMSVLDNTASEPVVCNGICRHVCKPYGIQHNVCILIFIHYIMPANAILNKYQYLNIWNITGN